MKLFNWVGDLMAKKTPSSFLEAARKALAEDNEDQAEKLLEKAVEMAEETKDHDTFAAATYELGKLNEKHGKNAVAETFYRKSFRSFEDSEDFDNTGIGLLALGRLYQKMARKPEAEQLFHYAMSIYQTHFGAEDKRVADAAFCLASTSVDQKVYPEAIKLFTRALGIYEKELGTDQKETAETLYNLALACSAEGTYEKADTHFKRAIEVFEKINAAESRELGLMLCACYHEYGRMLLKQKKKDRAKPLLEKAAEICQQQPGYLAEAELADDVAAC